MVITFFHHSLNLSIRYLLWSVVNFIPSLRHIHQCWGGRYSPLAFPVLVASAVVSTDLYWPVVNAVSAMACYCQRGV